MLAMQENDIARFIGVLSFGLSVLDHPNVMRPCESRQFCIEAGQVRLIGPADDNLFGKILGAERSKFRRYLCFTDHHFGLSFSVAGLVSGQSRVVHAEPSRRVIVIWCLGIARPERVGAVS
jgi:hypothetical protein